MCTLKCLVVLEHSVSLPPLHAGAYGRLLCALLILLVLQATSAHAGTTAVIQAVDVGAEHVVVRLSAPSAFTQAALPKDREHQRADRCYIDVSPAVLGQLVRRLYAVNSQRIQQVRAAQFQPGVVRVVLDLAAARTCQVRKLSSPDRLHITVGRLDHERERETDVSGTLAPSTLRPFQALETAESQPPTNTPLEYLDLRTPWSPEAEQSTLFSLFGGSPADTATPLSLLGRPPAGNTAPR